MCAHTRATERRNRELDSRVRARVQTPFLSAILARIDKLINPKRSCETMAKHVAFPTAPRIKRKKPLECEIPIPVQLFIIRRVLNILEENFKKIFPIPIEIEKFFRIVKNIDSTKI